MIVYYIFLLMIAQDLQQLSFQHMSVKEKIALYNNLAANDQALAAQNALKKANNLQPNQKPKVQEPTNPSKTQQIQNNIQPSAPSTVKVEQTHHTNQSQQKSLIDHGSSSAESHQNISAEGLGKQPEKTQGQAQAQTIPAQSEVLKKLEQQFASKGFSFMVPPEPKKSADIQELGPKGGQQLEVEKNAPIGSVKEHAIKLAQFYKNQNSNIGNPQPGVQINFQYSSPQQFEDFKPTEQFNNPTEQSNNCLNISSGTFFSEGSSFPVQSGFPQPQWESPPWEVKNQLQVRQSNKAKGAKLTFQDDE